MDRFNVKALSAVWATVAFTTLLGAVIILCNITGLSGAILRCILGLASVIAVGYGSVKGAKAGFNKYGKIAGWIYVVIESVGIVGVMAQAIMAKGAETADADSMQLGVYALELFIFAILGVFAVDSKLANLTKWLICITLIATYIITISPVIPGVLDMIGGPDPNHIILTTNSIIKVLMWGIITCLSVAQGYKKA